MTTDEITTLLYNIFGINFTFDKHSNNRYYNTIAQLEINYGESYINIYFNKKDYNLIQQKLNNSKYGYIQQFYPTVNCFEFVLYNSLKNIDI